MKSSKINLPSDPLTGTSIRELGNKKAMENLQSNYWFVIYKEVAAGT